MANVEIIIEAIDRASSELATVKSALKETGDAGDKASSRAGGGWKDAVQGVVDFGNKLYGTMQTAKRFADTIGQTINKGFQFTNAKRSFATFSDMIGVDATIAMNDLREATAGMVSDFDMAQAGARFFSMGLADSSAQAAQLAEIAVTLGGAMGKSATPAMEEFALLLANRSIPRLDTFGISAGKVRARIAELKAEGMGIDEAFTLAVIEDATPKLEALGGAANIAGTELSQLQAKLANVGDALSEGASMWVEAAAVSVNDLVGIAEIAFDPNIDFEAVLSDAGIIQVPVELEPTGFETITEALADTAITVSGAVEWLEGQDPAAIDGLFREIEQGGVTVQGFWEWAAGQDPAVVQAALDLIAQKDINLPALIEWTEGKTPETVEAAIEAISTGDISVEALALWSEGKSPTELQTDLEALNDGEISVIAVWGESSPDTLSGEIETIEGTATVSAELEAGAKEGVKSEVEGITPGPITATAEFEGTLQSWPPGEVSPIMADAELSATAMEDIRGEVAGIDATLDAKIETSKLRSDIEQAMQAEPVLIVIEIDETQFAGMEQRLIELGATGVVIDATIAENRRAEIEEKLSSAGVVNIEAALRPQRIQELIQELHNLALENPVEFGYDVVPGAAGFQAVKKELEAVGLELPLGVSRDTLESTISEINLYNRGAQVDPVKMLAAWDIGTLEGLATAAEQYGDFSLEVRALLGEDVGPEIARGLMALDLAAVDVAVELSGESEAQIRESLIRVGDSGMVVNALLAGQSLATLQDELILAGADVPIDLQNITASTDNLRAALAEAGLPSVAVDAFIEEQSVAGIRAQLDAVGVDAVVIDAVLADGATEEAQRMADELETAALAAERLENASQGISEALGVVDVSGLTSDIREAFSFLEGEGAEELDLTLGITTDAQVAFDDLMTDIEAKFKGGEISEEEAIELAVAIKPALETGAIGESFIGEIQAALDEGGAESAIEVMATITELSTEMLTGEEAPTIEVQARITGLVMGDEESGGVEGEGEGGEGGVMSIIDLSPEATGLTLTQEVLTELTDTITAIEIDWGPEAIGLADDLSTTEEIMSALSDIPDLGPGALGLDDALEAAKQLNATLSEPINKTVNVQLEGAGVEYF